MKYLTFIPVLFFALSAFAQQTVSDSLAFQKGIYSTFFQFKSNVRSSSAEFTFKNRTSGHVKAWGGTEYEISFPNKDITKKFIRENIWAVNDGKDFYINNRLFSINNGFNKLVKYDYPISYFVGYVVMRDEAEDRAIAMSMFGAIGGGMAAIPYKRVVAIDMINGQVIRMNDAGFLSLMRFDKELLNEYYRIREIKDNEEHIFKLLDAYNAKHRTEQK